MYSLPLLSRSTGMEGDRSFSSASNCSNAEDNEYVWDGFTHGDQLVATPGDGDYYEDLELAARLGKTLLQKNKELDTLNYQLRCCNEEQSLEIEHLNKQLTWLRDVNESKARMFEQLDINYQEMEATNRKLRVETREWKERVTKCMSVSESQEEQIQDLKAEIESVRKLHEGKRAKERMRRRTIHGCLPTTDQDEGKFQKFFDTSIEISGNSFERSRDTSADTEQEVAALHEVIGNLRAQQVMDKRMIKEMRKELEAVVQENQDCAEKLQEERENTQRLSHIIEEYDKAIYRQAFVAESTPNITEEFTNNEINFSDHSDYEEGLEKHIVLNQLSTLDVDTRSLFQSPAVQVRTPMSQYLRIANSTPLKTPDGSQTSRVDAFEEDNDDVAEDLTERQDGYGEIPNTCRPIKSEPKNVSLVQELDTQYKTLLGKYEMLLHSIESERVSSPMKEHQSNPEAGSSFLTESSFATDSSVDVSSKGHLSRQSSSEAVPEYKRLFREIFDMLHTAKDEKA